MNETLKETAKQILKDLLVELKRKFRDSKYNPKINFKGYTECFSIEKLKEIKISINKLKL